MTDNPEKFSPVFSEDGSASPYRLTDLLSDRALGELAVGDLAELEGLILSAEPGDHDAFDRIAAALQLSLMKQPFDPLPDSLRQKVLAAAGRAMAPTILVKPATPLAAREPVKARRTGWFIRFAPTLAAAAILLIAFSMSIHPKVSPAAARQSLLDSAKDVVLLSWTATEEPAARGAGGDVAWSNTRQTGYMRFTGLPKNNPLQEQYQLWIFDPGQDARYPVDGGVFDIDNSSGEVIIPIAARLRLAGPTLFAITIEKPGGVVVSDRKRLPLLAKVPTGAATQSK